jgi:TIR domain
MPGSVFISYSHKDRKLVQPVVALLRGTVASVFHDVNEIRPGKKWRHEIQAALRAVDLVVLFWCVHSSRSEEVKKECTLALSCAKDVMPLLLDSTPLPAELRVFEWVDFRDLVGRVHRSDERVVERLIQKPIRVILVFCGSLLLVGWALTRIAVPPWYTATVLGSLAVLSLLVFAFLARRRHPVDLATPGADRYYLPENDPAPQIIARVLLRELASRGLA